MSLITNNYKIIQTKKSRTALELIKHQLILCGEKADNFQENYENWIIQKIKEYNRKKLDLYIQSLEDDIVDTVFDWPSYGNSMDILKFVIVNNIAKKYDSVIDEKSLDYFKANKPISNNDTTVLNIVSGNDSLLHKTFTIKDDNWKSRRKLILSPNAIISLYLDDIGLQRAMNNVNDEEFLINFLLAKLDPSYFVEYKWTEYMYIYTYRKTDSDLKSLMDDDLMDSDDSDNEIDTSTTFNPAGYKKALISYLKNDDIDYNKYRRYIALSRIGGNDLTKLKMDDVYYGLDKINHDDPPDQERFNHFMTAVYNEEIFRYNKYELLLEKKNDHYKYFSFVRLFMFDKYKINLCHVDGCHIKNGEFIELRDNIGYDEPPINNMIKNDQCEKVIPINIHKLKYLYGYELYKLN